MKAISIKVGLVAMCVSAVACTNLSSKPGAVSSAKDFAETNEKSLNAVADAPTALAAARALGFLGDEGCAAHLKGGEEVMFATTEDRSDERGQASGILEKTAYGIFFRQKAIQRSSDRAQAPGIDEGAASGIGSGQTGGILSNWEFTSYFQTICRTAFNLDGLLPQPLYTRADASIVDVEGGSAGLKYAQKGVLRIKFWKDLDAGNWSSMTLYLKKGFGPVGLETAEDGNPHGALFASMSYFRLFINDAGGTGIGDGPSQTQEVIAAKANCAKVTGAIWQTEWNQCWVEAPSAKTADECFAMSGKRHWEYSCYEVITGP